jgi:hypothetical protein
MNECTTFYEEDMEWETEEGDKLRFPDTGQQCFFRESLYPMKPWHDWSKYPYGCKVW